MVAEHRVMVQFLLVNPLFTGIFQPPPHRLAGVATVAASSESCRTRRRNLVGTAAGIAVGIAVGAFIFVAAAN